MSPDTESRTMRVDLDNLTPLARDFIATSIALFTDPSRSMAFHRSQLLAGKIALAIEDGEVTWVEPNNETTATTA